MLDKKTRDYVPLQRFTNPLSGRHHTTRSRQQPVTMLKQQAASIDPIEAFSKLQLPREVVSLDADDLLRIRYLKHSDAKFFSCSLKKDGTKFLQFMQTSTQQIHLATLIHRPGRHLDSKQ